jgi:tight adherence protein C
MDVKNIKSQNNGFVTENYQKTRSLIIDLGERQIDKSDVKKRLEEIGKKDKFSYGEFRFRQLVVASSAAVIPFVALFLMLINFIQTIGLAIFAGIGSYLVYDNHLSAQVKQRRDLIESEFPAIVEMLTLAIAAGETPIGAFARIADRSDCHLSNEFAKVVAQVRVGRPLHEALDEMARKLQSSSIRRFIDALVMALLRGAPIVEVLHRHVAEARINQRNLVMDKAGKAETTMMIPIVFLILPISVLFALWPSINQLSFFAG